MINTLLDIHNSILYVTLILNIKDLINYYHSSYHYMVTITNMQENIENIIIFEIQNNKSFR